jgi:hypothetical protein
MAQHFPHGPPSVGSSRCHGWSPLAVALRRQLAPSLSWLHEGYPEGSVWTHKMIVSPPPLQVGKELWGGLRGGPGATRQSCHSMTDGQIHPFNKSGVESSREPQSLQSNGEICLCPKPHHRRDPN